MIRHLLPLIFLALTINTAWGAVFGPASPSGEAGNVTIGAGYHPFSADLENNIELDQSQYYAQLGVNFTNNVGMYVLGGGTDSTLKNPTFEDGDRPFGGLGFKALLTGDSEPFGIGFFAQGLYFGDSEEENSATATTVTLTEHFQANGGLVIQAEWDGGIIYGGPIGFLHSMTAETEVGGLLTSEVDIEEDGNIGGFLGVNWRAGEDVFFEIEVQKKTKLTGGANILVRF